MSGDLFYVRTLVIRSDGYPQERKVACLKLNCLPYWLGLVNINSVKPKLREKISLYKMELAEVAWSAYRDHILPPDVLAKISTETNRNLYAMNVN